MTFRCTYGRPAFRLEGRQLAPNELAGPGGPRAGTGTGNGGGTPRSTGGAMRVRSSEELLPCDTGCRQYVAVGVPAGKAMAGMLVLSASGALVRGRGGVRGVGKLSARRDVGGMQGRCKGRSLLGGA